MYELVQGDIIDRNFTIFTKFSKLLVFKEKKKLLENDLFTERDATRLNGIF